MEVGPITTKEVEAKGLGGWTRLLLVLGVFIVPIFAANWLRTAVRLPDQGLRIFFVVFAICASVVVMIVGWPPKLGIDLRGGVILVYQVKPDQSGNMPVKATMDELASTIKRRLDPSNIKEIVIRPYGLDKIEVIVPSPRKAAADGSATDDQDELDRIKKQISTSGMLEFRIAANSHKHQVIIDRAREQQREETAKGLAWSKVVRGRISGDEMGEIAKWVPVAANEAAGFGPPTFETRTVDRGSLGQELQVLLVNDPQNVTGEYLVDAGVGADNRGQPAVTFRFNAAGGIRFEQLTSQNLPQDGHFNQLAIVLDNFVQSAPRINSTISTNGIIEGNYKEEDAALLAGILKAGGLPASLDSTPLSEQVVSATLGQDTIDSGVRSMLVATGVVIVFMIIYYRFAGIVANIALILNVTLTVAFMIMFNAAFTLAGLAGLALTVGMAVDANVLIYERMREELNRGATLRMAIRNGFDRASITIVDANLTTLITAIVLYMIGTDQVKGFAVTLTVGIVMNLFTAITVSRLIFDIAERNRWISNLRFMQIMGGTNFDFIGKRKFCYALSAVVLIVGLLGAIKRGSDLLNIDFTGGVSVTAVFDGPPAGGIAKVREEVEKVLPEATVQQVNSTDFAEGAGFKIVTSEADRTVVENKLKEAFGKELLSYKVTVAKTESTGPALTIPANSNSAVPSDEVEAIAADEAADDADQLALADVGPYSDGFDSDAGGDECQGTAPTATATGTKPAATATATAAAKPTATATGTAPRPTATASATTTAKPAASPTATAAATGPRPTATASATAAPSGSNTIRLPAGAPMLPTGNPLAPLGLPVTGPAATAAPASATSPVAATTSGTLVSLTFEPKIDFDKLQQFVQEAAGDVPYDVTAPGYEPGSDTARSDWQVRLSAAPERVNSIIEGLKADFAEAPFFPSTEVVGAAVAGGAKRSAILAMIVSLLMVMAYVWFRFQNVAFGIAAIAALVHDVLFTIGCLALSRWLAPFLGFALVEPFKIDLTIVAAILTIIGFSINDTIVIFDRIREVRGKSPTLSGDLINLCLNQTLSRTILTSLTVFMVVLILYFFGGPGIHGFAFALVVGTVSGTYSTIYVASPLLLWFYRKPNATAAQSKGTAASAG
ncbi:MAG: protein translocase subunit SecD [Planctomycetaceae bacterium]|nr:protein translocase subunit SecD [Planctomycetaceae bacterium]